MIGRLIFAAVAFTSIGGCFAASNFEQLKERAAFDFNCPQAELKYVAIDRETIGVTGCGQRATYVERCKGHAGTTCTWLRN
jgi:hypothetical protein